MYLRLLGAYYIFAALYETNLIDGVRERKAVVVVVAVVDGHQGRVVAVVNLVHSLKTKKKMLFVCVRTARKVFSQKYLLLVL